MPGFLLSVTDQIQYLPSEWRTIYSADLVAARSGGRHVPIPTIVTPFLLTGKILAFDAISPSARSSWLKAGSVSQRIRTGRFVGGGIDEQVDWKFLPLGNSIQIFDKWDGDYSVAVTPAKHLKDFSLKVLEPVRRN